MKYIFLMAFFSSSFAFSQSIDYKLDRAPDYSRATEAAHVQEIKGVWLLKCSSYQFYVYGMGQDWVAPGRAIIFDNVDPQSGLQTLNVSLEVGEESSWEKDIDKLKKENAANGLSLYKFALFSGEEFLYKVDQTYYFFVYNYFIQGRTFCRSVKHL